MRYFLLNEKIRKQIKALRKFAEENVFSMDDLLDIKNGAEPCAGDREGFAMIIPLGVRIVFSMEQQPAGMVRHLSMSVPDKGKFPSPPVVELVAHELGYTGTLQDWRVSVENNVALNILQVVL